MVDAESSAGKKSGEQQKNSRYAATANLYIIGLRTRYAATADFNMDGFSIIACIYRICLNLTEGLLDVF